MAKLRTIRALAEQSTLATFNEVLLPALPPGWLRWDNDYFIALCTFLDTDHPKKLLKVSRDMAKSTALLAYSIKEILANPMIAAGWGHGVQELAIKKSLAVRWHFVNNKFLKRIAPDICFEQPQHQSEKWTEKAWTINRPHGRPDIPTFMCFGMDNIPTSVHLDLALLDDLEIKENSTTPELRLKLKEAFLDFLPILGPTARRIVSGTPWSFSGLMMLLSQDPEYLKFIAPCYVNKEELHRSLVDQVGYVFSAGSDPLWPERWPKNLMDKRIAEVGPKTAAAQYFLTPLPSSYMTFRPEYFNNRRLPDSERTVSLRFLYLDPTGYSTSGKSAQLCEAGFCSVLWCSDKLRYVESAYGAILSPWETLCRVFEEAERDFIFPGGVIAGNDAWRRTIDDSGGPDDDLTKSLRQALRDQDNHSRQRLTGGLVVEVNMPTVTADDVNREQRRRYGRQIFTVHEIKHSSAETKKGDYGRIAKLQPFYVNGEIVHAPSLSGGPLEMQLIQYPEAELVDLADAEAMMLEEGWFPAMPEKTGHRTEAGKIDVETYVKNVIKSRQKQQRNRRGGIL